METTPALELVAALADVSRLRAQVATSEESRDLQRRALGSVLPKTEQSLLCTRRALAAALLRASRLLRDAGLDEQALELLREHAAQAHLVEGLELRAAAGR
jgi:hypothetical protein